jgi:hypothetical protein
VKDCLSPIQFSPDKFSHRVRLSFYRHLLQVLVPARASARSGFRVSFSIASTLPLVLFAAVGIPFFATRIFFVCFKVLLSRQGNLLQISVFSARAILILVAASSLSSSRSASASFCFHSRSCVGPIGVSPQSSSCDPVQSGSSFCFGRHQEAAGLIRVRLPIQFFAPRSKFCAALLGSRCDFFVRRSCLPTDLVFLATGASTVVATSRVAIRAFHLFLLFIGYH